MRRFWIGIVLLAVLLAAGTVLLLLSSSFQDRFCQTLTAAAAAAGSEDWQRADGLVREAACQWQRQHRFFACFTDHAPLEQVAQQLSRLQLLSAAQLTVEFSETCGLLVHICQAIDETHSLNWWSVL